MLSFSICRPVFMNTLFRVVSLVAAVVTLTWIYKCPGCSPSIESSISDDINSFSSQWCRLQTWRVDWESVISPCLAEMSWDKRDVTSRKTTSWFKSYVSTWELSRAGHFSRIWIQSVDMDGNPKRFGGDSWRVYIRQGPASLAPLVIDHDNGMYEVLVLVTEPGKYYAGIYLDYSLCNGYRDPPRKFFRNGTNQGLYVNIDQGFLGNISADFINKPLAAQTAFKFDIEADEQNRGHSQLAQSCGISCSHMWDGYGRWVNYTWKSYSPVIMSRPLRHRPLRHQPHTLLVIGDSNSRRFFQLASKSELCKTVFKHCELVQNWLYEFQMDRSKMVSTDEFNASYALDLFRRKLSQPHVNIPESTLVFNLGIHYSLGLTFSQYQDLLTQVISLLKETGADGRPKYRLDIIWRGTTMIEREKLSPKYSRTLFRFHTNQRIQLFHCYATRVMCAAGFKVIDMYPLSSSYPKGTKDNVHYDLDAFGPAISILNRYYRQPL